MPNQREKTKKLPKCPECGHRLKPKHKYRPIGKAVFCRNPRCRAGKVSCDGKKILSDKTPKL